MKHPVVFFDRDGTLNVEAGYIRQLEDLKMVAGAAQAVSRLNQAKVATVLVTNQSGAARGYYPESHIQRLNSRVQDLLQEQAGARVDGVYYCPHMPDSTIAEYALDCSCRKPKPGMIINAFNDNPNLNRLKAYIVGDKYTDIELASNCGMKGILVKTGYGAQEVANSHQWKVAPCHIAPSVVEAIEWILQDLS